MKERKGPLGGLAGNIVDSVVQTARRRAADREPRTLIYDSSGLSTMVRPGAPGGDDLVAAAGKLIDLATKPPPVTGDFAPEDEDALAEVMTDGIAEPEIVDGEVVDAEVVDDEVEAAAEEHPPDDAGETRA